MKQNMSTGDRIIRILAAILIVALWYAKVLQGTVGYILLVIAGVFLLTSIVGSCPLYSLLGISTCKRKRAI